jgi:lipoate synthase
MTSSETHLQVLLNHKFLRHYYQHLLEAVVTEAICPNIPPPCRSGGMPRWDTVAQTCTREMDWFPVNATTVV